MGDDVGIGDDTEESLLVSALEVIRFQRRVLSNSTESIGGLFGFLRSLGGGSGGGMFVFMYVNIISPLI